MPQPIKNSIKTDNPAPPKKGRGARTQTNVRFERIHLDTKLDDCTDEDTIEILSSQPKTEFYVDETKTVISENRSPDVPFRYSLNPYRGCEHGCSYCYARPTHEYLGLSAGLDFETKILVKENAPLLFRNWLNRKNYRPESISFSGVTDCYQPIERQYELTRQCLQVAQQARHPIGVITKNALIERDLDILKVMAAQKTVRVAISITTLDAKLARNLEPRTSSPQARLRAVRSLTDAGVQVIAMIAPIIPGLNDHEIPAILEAASAAGAIGAGYVMLRLPFGVKDVFAQWLRDHRPLEADKIIGRIQSVRDGNLNQNQFGTRMSGTGILAEQIRNAFRLFRKKYGMNDQLEPMDCSHFCRPNDNNQGFLF